MSLGFFKFKLFIIPTPMGTENTLEYTTDSSKLDRVASLITDPPRDKSNHF